MLPDSGGRPYEVVVIGDADSMVYNALSASTDALPQHEPMFDVECRKQMTSPMQFARNIVVVSIDRKRYRKTEVRYKRNVYAEPQTIVYLCSPTAQQLRKDMATHSASKAVISVLNSSEMALAKERLAEKHNPKMEEEVRRMFGIDIRIPSDMTSSKHGKNFIWISNDSPTAMTNICIYTSTNRDSVMKANIKGETDNMYMTTSPGSMTTRIERIGGTKVTISRGLWEMQGDDMGGPFVSHTIKGVGKHTQTVVEAFIYAPGMKKRNLMLQTEAALYTARKPSDK